jgi:hypothetical protein
MVNNPNGADIKFHCSDITVYAHSLYLVTQTYTPLARFLSQRSWLTGWIEVDLKVKSTSLKVVLLWVYAGVVGEVEDEDEVFHLCRILGGMDVLIAEIARKRDTLATDIEDVTLRRSLDQFLRPDDVGDSSVDLSDDESSGASSLDSSLESARRLSIIDPSAFPYFSASSTGAEVGSQGSKPSLSSMMGEEEVEDGGWVRAVDDILVEIAGLKDEVVELKQD